MTTVRTHFRIIRLRDGRLVRFPVREHARTGKGSHRLTHERMFPAYQREELERLRSQIDSAGPPNDSDYLSPEEIGAQSYMDRQRRLLLLRQRRR